MNAVMELLPVNSDKRLERQPSKRNLELLNKYSQGKTIIELAQEFQITTTRCYQIIHRWRSIVKLDREREKLERFRRLKRAEMKASDEIAPEDCDQLVRVIEAQRKELEGDSPASTTNNITMIANDIKILNVSDKWNMLRSSLEAT